MGQLLIGATFTEGAKLSSQQNKNWEAIDEDDESEEENYDLTQAMLMPSAGKIDK